jgi:MIP family channel proteins
MSEEGRGNERRVRSGRKEALDPRLDEDLDMKFERRGERGGREDENPMPERRAAEERASSAERPATRRSSTRRSSKGRSSGGGGGLYGSDVEGNIVRAAVAEVVGTFILVFTGTAVATAAILGLATAGADYGSLGIALAFGVALVVVVASIGHVSGAHVNPAVTLGLAATGKFPWTSVPVYLGAQLLGAVLGALGTWISFGGPGRTEASLAATFPAQGVGDLQALAVEILITFILVFVVISVATDERVPAAVAPYAVGLALAAGVFIAGPVTGGAVNPARALGPMILAGEFTAAWVYILGPIVGGVLAAVLYDRFISDAEPPE